MIVGVQPLETSYLVPDPVFLLVFLAVFGVLLLWPLVEALARGRLGWAVAILLLAPVAGIFWFAVGRRTTRPA